MSFIEEVLVDVRDLKYEIKTQQDVIQEIKSQLIDAANEESNAASDLAATISSQMAKIRNLVVEKMSHLSLQTDDPQEPLVPGLGFGLYGLNSIEIWLTLGFLMMIYYVVYRLVSLSFLIKQHFYSNPTLDRLEFNTMPVSFSLESGLPHCLPSSSYAGQQPLF
jgi:hypothetical protein